MKKILHLLICICFLLIQNAFAQTHTVTGTVTAKDDGLPLPGVTVKINGTNIGTPTDQHGKYSITAAPGSTLVFSFIAYTTQEIVVGNKTVINVVLVPNSQQLTEVVVTGALGISRRVKSLGYAETTVKPEQIIQKSEPDVLKALDGKVAGVDIRNSEGTPGAATRITIRGASSFFGDNQPLIVVDGVPFSNDQVTTTNQTNGAAAYGSGIADLDPNDIESMTVLKGAGAAALYGSRAANGAIIVTTKSGNASRSKKGTEITFRSSTSIEQVANYPNYQNLYGAGTQGNYANSNGSWGPAFNAPVDGVNGLVSTNGVTSIPTWAPYLAAFPNLFGPTVPYKAYPNNVKDLFQNGSVYENSVTISSGDDKNSVSATGSQLNQQGYVSNATYERTNFSIGGVSKLSNGVNIHANASYSRSTQVSGYFGENQVAGVPSQFARSLFLARNWDLNLPFEDASHNPVTPNGGGQFDNPRWSAKYNSANTAEERFIANFKADKDFTKWMNLSFALGTNVTTLNRREVVEIGSRASQGTGSIILDNNRGQEIESTTLLSFTPHISHDITVKPIVGFEYNQRTATRDAETGNIFVVRGIHELTNTSQQIFSADSYQRQRLMGLFGDLDLAYKDYAFLTLTGRNDWSSTLAANARSYFYYSAAGSFVFTDALKIESGILDFGKIRASYSKVGHDADPYNTSNVFIVGTNFLGQSTGAQSTQANSPNLQPEFTTETEIGTQLSFFKSRVSIDFAFYNRNSTNELSPVPVAPSTGYGIYYSNFGSINNKGVELTLNVVPVKTSSFSWNIGGTFTKNKGVVTSLAPGVTRVILTPVLAAISPYLEVGHAYGYLRGSKNYRDSNGNLIVNPASGGLIENPDQGDIGDPNPKAIFSVNNTLNYKGFSLYFQFDAHIGGAVYSETINTLLGRGVTKDTQNRNSTWVIPGVYGSAVTGQPILDAKGNEIPNTTQISTNDLYFGPNGSSETFGINAASEWEVFDATVYRLRELTLGYNIPKSLYSKWPVGAIKVSLSGKNLWYYAPNVPKYSHFDPETGSYGASNTQGIELSSAPTVRRYGINLIVTF